MPFWSSNKSSDIQKSPEQALKSERALVNVDSGNSQLATIEVKTTKEGDVQTLESFGIEAVVESRPGMFSPIVEKGSTLPVSKRKRYFPVQDNQRVIKVRCFKGEQDLAKDNVKLGEFVISGIDPKPRRDSKGVDITFTINKLGVVLVDAVERENPDNHLKVRLDYVDLKENLAKSVAKGVLKEVAGFFLPSGKKK